MNENHLFEGMGVTKIKTKEEYQAANTIQHAYKKHLTRKNLARVILTRKQTSEQKTKTPNLK